MYRRTFHQVPITVCSWTGGNFKTSFVSSTLLDPRTVYKSSNKIQRIRRDSRHSRWKSSTMENRGAVSTPLRWKLLLASFFPSFQITLLPRRLVRSEVPDIIPRGASPGNRYGRATSSSPTLRLKCKFALNGTFGVVRGTRVSRLSPVMHERRRDLSRRRETRFRDGKRATERFTTPSKFGGFRAACDALEDLDSADYNAPRIEIDFNR